MSRRLDSPPGKEGNLKVNIRTAAVKRRSSYGRKGSRLPQLQFQTVLDTFTSHGS
ncbi:hypothetical protein ACN4EW_12195 [Arthrospira platensis CENA650]